MWTVISTVKFDLNLEGLYDAERDLLARAEILVAITDWRMHTYALLIGWQATFMYKQVGLVKR